MKSRSPSVVSDVSHESLFWTVSVSRKSEKVSVSISSRIEKTDISVVGLRLNVSFYKLVFIGRRSSPSTMLDAHRSHMLFGFHAVDSSN